MKQYIQYHKAWERGNPLLFTRPKAFTEDIPQKAGHALTAVEKHSRVWLIYREAVDADEYYVAYTFNAVDFDFDDGKIIVLSEPGKAQVFLPPIVLTHRSNPWFSELLRRHGNFAFGFMPLNEEGVSNLETIRASATSVYR
jgi:hypothetical protein